MKRYHIAGLAVNMELSGRAERQAEAYLAPDDGPVDITLQCDAHQILALNPNLEDAETALYLGTGTIFSQMLLDYDGTYLHASAVILDGKAYLFSANSGVGKSTHTQKWCRLFGASYLNDDKPVLRLVDGVWMAYGTPWSGKHDLSSPVGVPLAAIAFLVRGEENSIRPIEPKKAVPLIINQSLRRLQSQQMERQLMLVDKLVRQTNIWELTCRNDDDAAILAYRVMTQSGNRK